MQSDSAYGDSSENILPDTLSQSGRFLGEILFGFQLVTAPTLLCFNKSSNNTTT